MNIKLPIYTVSNKASGVTIKGLLNFKRISKNLKLAQWRLDNQIMQDMIPFMPQQTGTFINVTQAQSSAMAGTGKVCAGAPPMGRFLYEGKVMIDPLTGSAWARAGAKKIVTDKPLTYANPMATPHWFETAKALHLKDWERLVADTMGEK